MVPLATKTPGKRRNIPLQTTTKLATVVLGHPRPPAATRDPLRVSIAKRPRTRPCIHDVKLWKRVNKQAGIENIRPHDLRRHRSKPCCGPRCRPFDGRQFAQAYRPHNDAPLRPCQRPRRPSTCGKNEALDGVAELGDGAEHALLEPPARQLGQEAYDGIEPPARGRREAKRQAGLLAQATPIAEEQSLQSPRQGQAQSPSICPPETAAKHAVRSNAAGKQTSLQRFALAMEGVKPIFYR